MSPEPNPTRYLAFESGGTKLVAGVAGADGRLLEIRKLLRGRDDRAGQSFERLLSLGETLRAEYEAAGGRFVAAGFAYGGAYDRVRERPWRCFHEEGWEDVDIRGGVEARFGLPAAVENDAKAAALGEAAFGAGRGARTVFYLTIGTGIGGGIVHQGRLVALGAMGEGELGHTVVDPDGPPCPCGGCGCLEAVASGPGLVNLARWMAPDADADPPAGPELMAAWRAGDAFSGRVIERAAELLGRGLAMAVNLVSPDRIVVGGGVGTANPDFLALAAERARPLSAPYFREFEVRPAELGEAVAPQGAALLARQRVADAQTGQ